MHGWSMTIWGVRERAAAVLTFSVVHVFLVQAASVSIETEDGALGGDWNVIDSASPAYISISTDLINSGNPGSAARVASYSVTFPEAGDYDLYARLYVGAGAYNDDSFFYANGFGTKSPSTDSDWQMINGLAGSIGFSGDADIVTAEAGTVGSGAWKWLKWETSFAVGEENLTRTFQIGAREDGLNIDKLVFGTAGYLFTVAELDAGGPGTPPEEVVIAYPPDVVAGNLIQFTENSAWCWYQDERVVVDQANGRLITGGVASGSGWTAGSARSAWVNAMVFDLQSAWPQRTELYRYGYTDDHNAPAFLIWPDGRTVAQYAGHNNDYLSRFRTLDGDTWLPETSFDWTSAGASGSEQTSYSNPYYLSAEGQAYSFVRCIENRSPHFLVSSDMGSTWSYGGQLVEPDGAVGYNSGYFRYSGNGIDRIDFICTEGHPRDLNTSIYHGYISNGMSFRSDGTVVDANLFDTNCPVSSDFTLVFAHGTELPTAMTNTRCWNSDVQHYPDGTVQAIIHSRNDGSEGYDTTIDPNHSFFFCRYDGTNWTTTYLCQAGTKMYSSEADYVGLGALSPNDPNTIFISTRYDPRAVTPGTTDTNQPYAAKREIWKGVTSDHGATFSWTPITENSVRDNFRPVVPDWDGSNAALLWFRGSYFTAQSYDAALVGLVELGSESRSLKTYVDATTGNTTYAAGGALSTGPGSGQWHLRTTAGNNGNVLASADVVAEDAPALKTTIPVPGPGTYDLWVNFWGNPVISDWRIQAGPAVDQMQVFRQMASKSVDPADYDVGPAVTNDSNHVLYQAYVGRATAAAGNTIQVFVDDNAINTGSTGTLDGDVNRTWYDGVSYARVEAAEPVHIQDVALSDPSSVTLTWNSLRPDALLSPTYTIGKKSALTNETWTVLAAGVPSEGDATTFTDNIVTNDAAFYRISSP